MPCNLHPLADSEPGIPCLGCWFRAQEGKEPDDPLIGKRLGGRGMTPMAIAARKLTCPTCCAGPGETCVTDAGKPVRGNHHSRRKAAREAMWNEEHS